MSTWNPADDANFTFSNGDRTITSTDGSLRGCRGSAANGGSGKWYFEVVITNVSAIGGIYVGVGDMGVSISSWAGGPNYGLIRDSGSTATEGFGTYSGTAPNYTTGDVIGIALDADANIVYFYKNNSLQGNFPSLPSSVPYKPMGLMGSGSGGQVLTLNTASANLVYTPPAGYSSWDVVSQLGRPISDISAGIWTPSIGTDLYATIDEPTALDSDYDTATDPSSSAFEVRLTSLADPSVNTGHIIRYRVAGIAGSINYTVALRQGTSTQIAAWTHNGVTTATTFTETLTGTEADSITNYTDLRLRFTATKV